MAKKTSKSFTAAADSGADKILDAIRAPEKDFLTAYYIAQRSGEVADGLLHLARAGETAAVTSFIVSEAGRFEKLATNGQLPKLMEALSHLDKKQQFKVLSATESELYGEPNVTVLQSIAKDKKMTGALTDIMRGFDTKQRTELLSGPRAVWWLSSYDQTPLLQEMAASLTNSQRQTIINKGVDAAWGIEESAPEVATLFKDCKPPKRRPLPTPS